MNLIKTSVKLNTSLSNSITFDNESGEKLAEFISNEIAKVAQPKKVKVSSKWFGDIVFTIKNEYDLVSPMFQCQIEAQCFNSDINMNADRLEEELKKDHSLISNLTTAISLYVESLNYNLKHIKHPINSEFKFDKNDFWIKMTIGDVVLPELKPFSIDTHVIEEFVENALMVVE